MFFLHEIAYCKDRLSTSFNGGCNVCSNILLILKMQTCCKSVNKTSELMLMRRATVLPPRESLCNVQ